MDATNTELNRLTRLGKLFRSGVGGFWLVALGEDISAGDPAFRGSSASCCSKHLFRYTVIYTREVQPKLEISIPSY